VWLAWRPFALAAQERASCCRLGALFLHAEESGLIVPIGEWVLREACAQAVRWQQAGLPELTMAVNLSAVQFRRGDLLSTA
jgi:EAL domain-containing protein (putative c-di-GMP-specific phosphodiesterase class I)